MLREVLGNEIFRDRGVPAPRSAFYRIYVDTGSGPEYLGPLHDGRGSGRRRDAGLAARRPRGEPLQARRPGRRLDEVRQGRVQQEDQRGRGQLRRRRSGHRGPAGAARQPGAVAREARIGVRRRPLPEMAGGEHRDRQLGHLRRDGPQLLPLRRPEAEGPAAVDPVGQQHGVRHQPDGRTAGSRRRPRSRAPPPGGAPGGRCRPPGRSRFGPGATRPARRTTAVHGRDDGRPRSAAPQPRASAGRCCRR